jgi:MFS family permease
MSAAIVDIRKDFPGYSSEMYIMSRSITSVRADWPVTSGFVLGFVVGPLIWAPCSEVFGRRNMFCFTFLPFTIFNAACCGAKSLETLIVLRFFAGTFGASCLTSTG